MMQVNAVASSPFAIYCVVDASNDEYSSTSRRAAVSHDMLAKYWGISLDSSLLVMIFR